MSLRSKLIIFDIGGVLIDYSKSFQTVSKDQQIPIEYIDDMFDKYENEMTLGELTPQGLYNKVLDKYSLEANREYDFLNSWVRDYLSIRETYNLIFEISKDFEIALLSNIYKGTLELLLEKNLIPNIDYSFTFISAELGLKKPEEEIYLYVEKKTELNCNQIYFIDDRLDFLEIPAKREWGTHLFHIKNPKESVRKIKEEIYTR